MDNNPFGNGSNKILAYFVLKLGSGSIRMEDGSLMGKKNGAGQKNKGK